MTTRTRITMLLLAVALIIAGSLLYNRENQTRAVDQPLQADGPKIDTTPPKSLQELLLANIQGKVKLGMTEGEVEVLFGKVRVESQHAQTGKPMWRYEVEGGIQLMIEWEAPNSSGFVEARIDSETETRTLISPSEN